MAGPDRESRWDKIERRIRRQEKNLLETNKDRLAIENCHRGPQRATKVCYRELLQRVATARAD